MAEAINQHKRMAMGRPVPQGSRRVETNTPPATQGKVCVPGWRD